MSASDMGWPLMATPEMKSPTTVAVVADLASSLACAAGLAGTDSRMGADAALATGAGVAAADAGTAARARSPDSCRARYTVLLAKATEVSARMMTSLRMAHMTSQLAPQFQSDRANGLPRGRFRKSRPR